MNDYQTLVDMLDYDPAGFFRWKSKPGKSIVAGAKVGYLNTESGYRMLYFNGRNYREHRVVWYYFNGYLPENNIDHINRDRSDNRIENLREVSNSCNSLNACLKCNNTSGIRGVIFNKRKGKWTASLMKEGKFYFMGYFSDKIEAIAHRLALEQCTGVDFCLDTEAKVFMEDYVKSIQD